MRAAPFPRRLALGGALALGAGGVLTACSSSAPADPAPGPGGAMIVVGHRGASGYRPEHTSAAYELAIRTGAASVDVDLAPTRDGALVARHEPEIGETTDVGTRPEFAGRRRTGVVIDGVSYDGWFTTDFTLDELRTLRSRERIPGTRPQNTLYDGRYPIMTLDEVLDLLDGLAAELRRPVGVLPEVKHSTYFASIGQPVEPILVDLLRRRGRTGADSGVIIQSFEVANLRALREQVDCELLQLVDAAGTAPADRVAAGDPRTYDDLLTPQGLRDVATYAQWLGPDKTRVTRELTDGVRAAGMATMPYTFRNENEFLPADLRRGRAGGDPAAAPPETFGDAFAEYARYREMGVEAVFSDHPDTAVEAARAGVR